MRIFDHQGKKTAVINLFIDPERGFLDLTLTDGQGGSLYVPDGEQVAPVMGRIVGGSRGAIFILGQDYHPRNHVSFMANHPGVMEYRLENFQRLVESVGQNVPPDAAALAQKPFFVFKGGVEAFPFDELVLDEKRNIIGLKTEKGRIRHVVVETASGLAPDEKDRGRVTKVLDACFDLTFDEYRAQGRALSTQTLWSTHCVQGTESCHFPTEMKLPQGLVSKLEGDLMSPYIHHHDAASDNEFYVIRKGANSEVDSYGIGVENDGKTLTRAWDVFGDIAESLKARGCERVIVNGGGLATNFCVEFSLNNVADFLAGHFKMRGMEAEVNFVPEISRGIPIPGGAGTPFSLAGTPDRLKARGINSVTVAEVLALQVPPAKKPASAFKP